MLSLGGQSLVKDSDGIVGTLALRHIDIAFGSLVAHRSCLACCTGLQTRQRATMGSEEPLESHDRWSNHLSRSYRGPLLFVHGES
eukprot:6436808-Amphidinium_carterae.1